MKKIIFGALIFLYASHLHAQTTYITAFQYYYNSDPGVGIPGNGGIINITPDDSIDISIPISLNGTIGNGPNYLYLRTRDQNGNWSIAERRAFYVQKPSEQITALQYFYDTDPATGIPGNGGIIPVTGGVSAIDTAITLPTPVLQDGSHYLYLRSKDEYGRWSIAERRNFYIQKTSQQVSAIQYFFDTDPAVGIPGNGGVIPITSNPGAIDTMIHALIPGFLPLGSHYLYVRTKDNYGRWGIAERRNFYAQKLADTIKAMEYYIDNDVSGPGHATPFSIASSDSIDINFNAGVGSSLDSGIHYLYVRAQDESGNWSIIGRDTFELVFVATLKLKLFIQGYYSGNGTMVPTLYNEGVQGNPPTNVDTVEVELHEVNAPFNLAYTSKGMLHTDGSLKVTYPVEILGVPYYVAVKHRNTLQTWSAVPVALNTLYNFTSSAGKAFGSNLIDPYGENIWSLYNGDMNQDESIDIFDFPQLDFDILSFNFGYFNTDLNGDGSVDIFDFPVLDGNVLNFIYSIHP